MPVRIFAQRLFFATLLLAALGFLSAPVMAQGAAAKDTPADEQTGKKDKEKKPKWVMLPKPLDKIESNAPKLSETELFKIVDAKFEYLGEAQQTCLVWTLRTQRRVSVRRALLLLRNLRDVRFYYKGEKTKNRMLIHQTVLEYSSVLDVLASQSKSLLPTEEVKVWIPLTDVERRRVIGRDANLLELGRLKPGLD